MNNVSTILHTALHIAGNATDKEFSMKPEYEMYETNKGKRKRDDDDFDYLYSIVTIGIFPGAISQASEIPFLLNLTRRPWTKLPRNIKHCTMA